MDLKNQELFLNKVLNEYREILNKYYPKLIVNTGYSGPQIHAKISSSFKDYNETPFYYKGPLKFVHWTSLSNLSSIINNNEIRLYNLINSEDQEEFSYAGQLLSLSERQINTIKDKYYTASFCRLENLEDNYLWKKYGRDFSGVAIVFSLTDNRDEWENIILSDVYYELDPTFKKLQEELKELISRYNNIPTLMNDIWRFAGYFKRQDFKPEKEVRLSYIFPFDYDSDYLRYVRKELKIDKGRNRIVSYIPLKLWTDPAASYFKTLDIPSLTTDSFTLSKSGLPQIKIEAIYIGD
ncbi:DUF2971 domain-containing protein [Phnomibacter ginsenosidimutans]|uniref:DUF2971 domain-containing protein n=1 Tax=Phnomibacter ginsenosidimutans TaxID=2676868 RepID=A0A6I6GJE3_9BACT|nr:DUF2971 domain-containing protein [Phnomibacter ginsenosidimutans]QGW28535.1 DUF2971 domain-containing protein [Phnomibacter ginsenosidimutans]